MSNGGKFDQYFVDSGEDTSGPFNEYFVKPSPEKVDTEVAPQPEQKTLGPLIQPVKRQDIGGKDYRLHEGAGKELLDRLGVAAQVGVVPAVGGTTPIQAARTGAEVAPILGTGIGEMWGGPIGAAVGAGLGETARQTVQVAIGDRERLDIPNIATRAIVAGGLSKGLNLLGKVMTPTLQASAKLDKVRTTISETAQVIDDYTLKNPGLLIPAATVIAWMQNSIKPIINQKGTVNNTFNYLMERLQQFPYLSFKELRNIRQAIGSSLKFSDDINPPNAEMEKVGELIYGKINKLMDGIARKAGVTNWDKLNKTASKLFKKTGLYKGRRVDVLSDVATIGAISSTLGIAAKSRGLGSTTALVLFALRNPSIQKAIYEGGKIGVGKAAATGGAEFLSRLAKISGLPRVLSKKMFPPDTEKELGQKSTRIRGDLIK